MFREKRDYDEGPSLVGYHQSENYQDFTYRCKKKSATNCGHTPQKHARSRTTRNLMTIGPINDGYGLIVGRIIILSDTNLKGSKVPIHWNVGILISELPL